MIKENEDDDCFGECNLSTEDCKKIRKGNCFHSIYYKKSPTVNVSTQEKNLAPHEAKLQGSDCWSNVSHSTWQSSIAGSVPRPVEMAKDYQLERLDTEQSSKSSKSKFSTSQSKVVSLPQSKHELEPSSVSKLNKGFKESLYPSELLSSDDIIGLYSNEALKSCTSRSESNEIEQTQTFVPKESHLKRTVPSKTWIGTNICVKAKVEDINSSQVEKSQELQKSFVNGDSNIIEPAKSNVIIKNRLVNNSNTKQNNVNKKMLLSTEVLHNSTLVKRKRSQTDIFKFNKKNGY